MIEKSVVIDQAFPERKLVSEGAKRRPSPYFLTHIYPSRHNTESHILLILLKVEKIHRNSRQVCGLLVPIFTRRISRHRTCSALFAIGGVIDFIREVIPGHGAGSKIVPTYRPRDGLALAIKLQHTVNSIAWSGRVTRRQYRSIRVHRRATRFMVLHGLRTSNICSTRYSTRFGRICTTRPGRVGVVGALGAVTVLGEDGAVTAVGSFFFVKTFDTDGLHSTFKT